MRPSTEVALVGSGIRTMAREVPYRAEASDLLDRQPRLPVGFSPSRHHTGMLIPPRFLDNITTDIIHYESKKVPASRSIPPPHSIDFTASHCEAGLLPWELIEVRQGTSRGRVLLHAGCHLDQVCVSSSWVAYGRAQQHAGDFEDD